MFTLCFAGFSLKTYLFQFANYYSSVFYVAYLKGKFVGPPAKYHRIFGFRQEVCMPGGCLMELCIQLVIIMVGKQALTASYELLFPFFMTAYKSLKVKLYKTENLHQKTVGISCNRWMADFRLVDWSRRALFDEYLEMGKKCILTSRSLF